MVPNCFLINLNLPTKFIDGLNHETTLEYDTLGRRIKKTFPDLKFEQYQYDPAGHPKVITDRRNNSTTYDYDELGRLSKVTNPDAQHTTREYKYDARGLLLQSKNERDYWTTFHYDDAGRLIKTTSPLLEEWKYEYDSAGNRSKEIAPDNSETIMSYDANNRLAHIIAPGASAPEQVFIYDEEGRLKGRRDERLNTTEFEYDSLGRLKKLIDPLHFATTYDYDAVGNRISEKDAEENETKYKYDSRGLLSERSPPGQGAEKFFYDGNGNLVRHEDFAGKLTIYEYDTNNRLVRITDAKNGKTEYEYDANGNRTLVRDPNLNETRFSYDERDRLQTRTDARNHLETFNYDGVGGLSEHIDRNGRKRTFEYDGNGRLKTEKWWSGAALTRQFDFSYDNRGNRTGAADSESALNFTFDLQNRLSTASNAGTVGVPSVALTYGYDAGSNVQSVTDNFGVAVNSVYSFRNDLSSRTWSGGGIAPARIDFDYESRGGESLVKRYSDLAGTQLVGKTIKTYDEQNRGDDISHQSSAATPLQHLAYQFDTVGRLWKETFQGVDATHLYDDLSQVTSRVRPGQTTETFSYDAGGNRNMSGYVTDPGNETKSNGAYNFVYDDEGNLAQKTNISTGEKTSLEWDHRNRLTKVTRKNSSDVVLQTTSFAYDPDNRRITKVVDGTGAHYVYDRNNVWAEFNDGGSITARYLFGDKVDEALARWRPGDGTTWYLTNHQGSVVGHLSNNGTLLNETTYSSYGKILNQTNPSVTDRYGYSGREYDNETGLYYYRNRYYDPDLGRFISEDPIDFNGGDANLYRYVGNGPANGTDPFGLLFDEEGALMQGIARTATSAANAAPTLADLAVTSEETGFLATGLDLQYGFSFAKIFSSKLIMAAAVVALMEGDNVTEVQLEDGTKIRSVEIEASDKVKGYAQTKVDEQRCDPKNPVPLNPNPGGFAKHSRPTCLPGNSCFDDVPSGIKFALITWELGDFDFERPGSGTRKKHCFGYRVGDNRNGLPLQCVTIVVRQDCNYHAYPSGKIMIEEE